MNLRQLESIVAIEEYGSMTAAAARLYVTPSALNQQLLKLEHELGLPLFLRVRHQMVPTAAGRIYLDNARQILRIKQNTYAQLQDLAGNYAGEYKIGLAYGHGNDAMLYCYPLFHKKYPGITLLCEENMVAPQLEKVRAGDLDMGLVQLTAPPDSDDQYVLLSAENLLLGMPVSHRLAHLGAAAPGSLPTIDLALLREDNFALMQRGSTQRQRIDPLFAAAGYQPRLLAESTQNRFLQSMAATQICCTIIPQAYATDYRNLVWFALPTHPRFYFYAVCKKGVRLGRAMSDLLVLVQEYAQAHLQFPEP